jgi:S1-C subfamily serine protease
VGDAVLAIGNPFGVGQTVTAGIVSALQRQQLGINVFESFIQTDAAINPGNSGGALVDAEGRLIGINTAIYSNSGGSLGIGFAIPIDAALQVMQALLKDGLVARGWIGVQTRELTPEFIEAFKLSVKEGVLISAVVVDAPAAKAGIKPGDVVTQVANKTVRSPAELLAAVAALTPKSQAAVAVQRGSQALVFQLAIGQRPLPQADDDD